MKTAFEIGKIYQTSPSISNLMKSVACKVIERTATTITIVEEYEEMPIVVPIQKMMDRYGDKFEYAKYLGLNLFSK